MMTESNYFPSFDSLYGGMRMMLVPRIVEFDDGREFGRALAAWRYGLTRDEIGILEYLAAGMSNAELALNLHVAEETTIKNRLKTIFTKIGATNRVQAARLAMLYGFAAQLPIPPRANE